MVCTIAQAIILSLMANPVAVSPQEWIREYKRSGGKAVYHEEAGWLGISIYDKDKALSLGLLRPKVTEVRLDGPAVRNLDVSEVLRWFGVRKLYLQNCTTLDDTVFPIIKSSKLQEIHMYDIGVTAAGISGLSGSKSLRIINLVAVQSNKFSDLNLIGLPQLQSLSLLNFNLTSVVLADMPKLDSLFDTTSINANRLNQLELVNLPKLKEVNFAWAPINKLVVKNCSSLEEIRVKKAKLSDDDVATLIHRNPKLKILQK